MRFKLINRSKLQRSLQYFSAKVINECRGSRRAPMPAQLSPAQPRQSAKRIDADACQRRLKPFHMLEEMEKAVTFVAVQQADRAAGRGETALCDQTVQRPGNLHAGRHARRIVERPRLRRVSHRPDFSIRVILSANHSAHDVMRTLILIDGYLRPNDNSTHILNQLAKLRTANRGNRQPDQRGRRAPRSMPPQPNFVQLTAPASPRPHGRTRLQALPRGSIATELSEDPAASKQIFPPGSQHRLAKISRGYRSQSAPPKRPRLA